MSHKEIIEKNGYCVFDLTKRTDSDSVTPIETKYSAIMLCVEGEATIEANMENHHLKKGDCLCVGNILYKRTTHMSDDFRARVLISVNSFAFDSVVGIPMGFMESLYSHPIAHVKEEKMFKMLVNYFDNLVYLQEVNTGMRHEELVVLSFRSILLLMAIMRNDTGDVGRVSFGQGDVYFRNFIDLIDNHVKENHEVAFYADKLHITPKYLSEICKQKSGHKAKEIISSFLISKMKQEMVMSSKSIKTIAYEYGFADQSSMGKFFSKLTGQSPGDFRKSVIGSIN